MKHQERIRGYFESHPETNKFFVTQDGAAFFTKENANAYAQVFKTEEERKVEEVNREDVMGKCKTDPETFDHVITQEDLDNNPEFVEQGIKVGEVIQVPVADDTAKKAPAKKAPAKKSTAKK